MESHFVGAESKPAADESRPKTEGITTSAQTEEELWTAYEDDMVVLYEKLMEQNIPVPHDEQGDPVLTTEFLQNLPEEFRPFLAVGFKNKKVNEHLQAVINTSPSHEDAPLNDEQHKHEEHHEHEKRASLDEPEDVETEEDPYVLDHVVGAFIAPDGSQFIKRPDGIIAYGDNPALQVEKEKLISIYGACPHDVVKGFHCDECIAAGLAPPCVHHADQVDSAGSQSVTDGRSVAISPEDILHPSEAHTKTSSSPEGTFESTTATSGGQQKQAANLTEAIDNAVADLQSGGWQLLDGCKEEGTWIPNVLKTKENVALYNYYMLCLQGSAQPPGNLTNAEMLNLIVVLITDANNTSASSSPQQVQPVFRTSQNSQGIGSTGANFKKSSGPTSGMFQSGSSGKGGMNFEEFPKCFLVDGTCGKARRELNKAELAASLANNSTNGTGSGSGAATAESGANENTNEKNNVAAHLDPCKPKAKAPVEEQQRSEENDVGVEARRWSIMANLGLVADEEIQASEAELADTEKLNKFNLEKIQSQEWDMKLATGGGRPISRQEVAKHSDTGDFLLISTNQQVLNATCVILKNYNNNRETIMPMVKCRGGDISHWFDSTGNPRTRIDLSTGKKVLYTPNGFYYGLKPYQIRLEQEQENPGELFKSNKQPSSASHKSGLGHTSSGQGDASSTKDDLTESLKSDDDYDYQGDVFLEKSASSKSNERNSYHQEFTVGYMEVELDKDKPENSQPPAPKDTFNDNPLGSQNSLGSSSSGGFAQYQSPPKSAGSTGSNKNQEAAQVQEKNPSGAASLENVLPKVHFSTEYVSSGSEKEIIQIASVKSIDLASPLAGDHSTVFTGRTGEDRRSMYTMRGSSVRLNDVESASHVTEENYSELSENDDYEMMENAAKIGEPEEAWWLESKYIVGYVPKVVFPLRVINSLTFEEVKLWVSKEYTINDCVRYYLPFNKEALDYYWRDMFDNVLHPHKTLVENGLVDADDPMDDYELARFPVIFLHYKDGMDDAGDGYNDNDLCKYL